MQTSRREFLKNSAFTIAGATLFSNSIFASANLNQLVGIQLYSVRDDMKTDPHGTLKKLSAMGYRHVEHAWYMDRKFYGYTPADFKKLLADLNMAMPSGHTVLLGEHWNAASNDFTDVWKKTVEDAAIAGQQLVITPGLDDGARKDYDSMLRFMEVFNKCGELCKKAGMKFGYHNHDFEFSDTLNGKKLFDIILENTDASLVTQQLDVGNMYGAGGIALDVIKKYPGRFESMHVKDEIKSEEGEMGGYESTILGKGVLPVKDIVNAGKKIGGTKHFIVEQESYQGKTPIDCVKDDLAVMKKWGY